MVKRIITGVWLVAIVVAFFLLRNVHIGIFNALIALFSIVGTLEILKAMGDKIYKSQRIVILINSILIVPMFAFFSLQIATAYLIVVFAVLFSLLVINYEKCNLENLGYAIIALVYPSIFLASMVLVNNFSEHSTMALLLVFIISPCSDVFAYIVGVNVKGKKLCPNISPKKTVSGAIGGLIGGIIGSFAISFIFIRSAFNANIISTYFIFALIGIICSLFTQFGDLIESRVKRNLNIKDSGKILPGHGGILDRIDGMLFASVVIYFMFSII